MFFKPYKLKNGTEGGFEYELNLSKFTYVVVILFSEFLNDSIDFGLVIPEKQDQFVYCNDVAVDIGNEQSFFLVSFDETLIIFLHYFWLEKYNVHLRFIEGERCVCHKNPFLGVYLSNFIELGFG